MIQGAWNRINTVLLLLLVLMLAGALAKGVFGGSLDPPGTPGPTMKSLEQVEPRTPISSLPYTISQPGSYYLTGNLTGTASSNGITILAADVTLDLNGFTLQGVPSSLTGIDVEGTGTVTIRNGFVKEWGSNGISGGTVDVTVEDVKAWSNGARGFDLSQKVVLSGVSAVGNGGDGIRVSVGGQIRNCLSSENAGSGVVASQAVIEGCLVQYNQGHGIDVEINSQITANTVQLNGAAVGSPGGVGIRATVSGNRIEDNNVVGNDVGIRVLAPGNVIVRNSARGNPTPYDVLAGNAFGPVVAAAGVSSDTYSWSNISY